MSDQYVDSSHIRYANYSLTGVFFQLLIDNIISPCACQTLFRNPRRSTCFFQFHDLKSPGHKVMGLFAPYVRCHFTISLNFGFYLAASFLFTSARTHLYTVAVSGTPISIPGMPNNPPPIVTAASTQIPGSPIEPPTTRG